MTVNQEHTVKDNLKDILKLNFYEIAVSKIKNN